MAAADTIILTGAVSPHYFAGFGGGRKSIMPGVCSMEANLQSHILVFNPPPAGGRNHDVGIARLKGNPVHEDMLEAAGMVNPHFILNTVVVSHLLYRSYHGRPAAKGFVVPLVLFSILLMCTHWG